MVVTLLAPSNVFRREMEILKSPGAIPRAVTIASDMLRPFVATHFECRAQGDMVMAGGGLFSW